MLTTGLLVLKLTQRLPTECQVLLAPGLMERGLKILQLGLMLLKLVSALLPGTCLRNYEFGPPGLPGTYCAF